MAQMPETLRVAIDALAAQCDARALTDDARMLSEAYRTRTGAGKRLLTREAEAAAYACARMPATFAAISAALAQALDASGLTPDTLLDCGAGTGAASFAADAALSLRAITCMEREAAMRAVGTRLMDACALSAHARWLAWDATAEAPLPRAALVVEGYMLGELAEEMRVPAALRLWAAAEQMLLLVEPGTPTGAENLARVREALCAQGAHIAAPCPAGMRQCPISGQDWCHFAIRVARTRLHKALKGGQAPYEDEKFCYLALTREPPSAPCAARVMRRPQVAPGRITWQLCTGDGLCERAVTHKDAQWKRARKAAWGDGV